ncbi:MAG TPA: SAM-dependent methyltransferase [Thermoguttaceae bacterium]|nr:SAM-dependent methyltransferase [Thermoguttaceae bacterium]
MRYHRIDPQETGLLFEVPWEEDRQYRMNPAVLTSLLREQVPVLDFADWNVTTVEPGVAASVLPLNTQSTNQHFTHQAALFLLAADYTGGIAVASLIMGWPVIGVHPVCSPKSLSLWLIKGTIKYIRPSVADLTISADVEPERHARIQRRFLQGKAVLESIDVHFMNGTVKVAEATLTYFARQSERLRSEGLTEKVNALYELKLTSSAELIAGVRGRESGRLFEDPYAAQMAGQHGMALADRFCQKLPQLGGMIAARTRHLDKEIEEFVYRGGRDIVILGVGWDMRAFRLPLPEGTRIYELDLPPTLNARQQRIAELGIEERPGIERMGIPVDLRSMPVADVLKELVHNRTPVFVVWEGMNMYFEEADVTAVLRGLAPLLGPSESRLWVDLVDKRAVEAPETFPRPVQDFMRGMQILGEPFIFGTDSVPEFMAAHGLHCRRSVASDLYFEDKQDPVYSLYRFCVASGAAKVPTARVSEAPMHRRTDAEEVASPHSQPASKSDVSRE